MEQSEEDQTLKNELEMLVERLRVCTLIQRVVFTAHTTAGARHIALPCSAGEPTKSYTHLHLFYDIRSKTTQVPPTTLPRPPEALRYMACVR